MRQSLFIQAWLKLYDLLSSQYSRSWDQASFRSVLWSHIKENNFLFLPLPEEANIRTPKPWTVGRGMPAFIVHGRIPECEAIAFFSYLNNDIDCFRTWSGWLNQYPESSIRPRYDRTFG